MGPAKGAFRRLQEKFGKVKPQHEYCRRDGSRLGHVSEDFSLTLRYTALACKWCSMEDQNFQDFKGRFDHAAKLLQDNDQRKRVEGAHMIVKLVEDGAGVIGGEASIHEAGPFVYCPNCRHIVGERASVHQDMEFGPCPNCGHKV